MKIVLDANVLLISISKKSLHRPIFDAIIEGKKEFSQSLNAFLIPYNMKLIYQEAA